MSERWFNSSLLPGAIFLACIALAAACPQAAAQATVQPCQPAVLGSPYIPVDSWIYPAVLRLYSLGLSTMSSWDASWTRASVSHMLEEAGGAHRGRRAEAATDEAQGIYDALTRELHADTEGPCLAHQGQLARRVSLLGGARHQRHAAARQLSSRLDDHQRLRPAL